MIVAVPVPTSLVGTLVRPAAGPRCVLKEEE
jgi:hypothetical protein